MATIERFAPGRIRLGIGTGWIREEFDALGVPFQRRGARLDEYIEALRTMWSGEPSSFDGEFYSWEESGFLPSPSAPIPLIVGGHSERALERAAKHGDGWAVVTTREQGYGIDALKARLEVLDRLSGEGRQREERVPTPLPARPVVLGKPASRSSR